MDGMDGFSFTPSEQEVAKMEVLGGEKPRNF
jgi:hypothetical protein